jgi:hypothetical protein
MRTFVDYLSAYWRNSSRPAFFITVFFIASLVTVNYTAGIEHRILAAGPWYVVYGCFFLFYSLVIALAWGLQYEWGGAETRRMESPRFFQPRFLLLLLLAPLFFAAKMVHWDLSPLLPLAPPWNRYWLIVLQLPAKLLLLCSLLIVCWKTGLLKGDSLRGSIGLTTRGVSARPYFGLLLLLIPVVALASTQPDFLRVYPKVKNIAFINGYTSPVWPWKAGYELSYGLDFLSIELFFRGLLVIGLVRYAGEQAILPMAAFYCTIHFGKPLGECISSFFGGLALGVLAYRTRSILGGLIVHLGLAWMMELGGWLAGG